MPNVVINCKGDDWKNSLRSMLRGKEDVDLINIQIEYDREFLENLAKEAALFFTFDNGTNAGFFRKEKLNL